MVTKKPTGLGLGLEALLGPKVSDSEAAAARDACVEASMVAAPPVIFNTVRRSGPFTSWR